MRRKLFQAGILALLLLLATWGLIEWSARQVEDRLENRFAELMGGMTVEERYPIRAQNSTVDDLQAIGTQWGIRMIVDGSEGGLEPTAEAAEAWQEIHASTREFLLEVRRRGRDDIPELDPEVQSLLEREAEAIARLRSVLLDQERPVWYMDIREGFEMRIPNYLALMQLQRVLSVEGLERWRQGDRQLFLETLEASWNLNQAIAAHPYLIAQLVAQAVLNDQIPLLLRLHDAPPVWSERIRRSDPVAGMLRSLQMEAWVAFASARDDRLQILTDRKLPGMARSFLRWNLSDHAERMLDFGDLLPGESLSGFDPERAFEEQLDSLPAWNVVGKMLMPNYYDAWIKAARAHLALDLVEKVTEARAAIETGTLDSFAGIRPASLDDLSWEIEVASSSVTIRLQDELPEVREHPLPLAYELEVPADPQ